jgi:O-antigen ligase
LALVLTLSRSGILALAAALVSAAFLMSRRQTTKPRRLLVAAYLLFVAIIVASWVGLDLIASRFADIEHSITERPAIWADTLAIMRRFWLTGTGLNTYGVSTLFYQTALPGEHLREAHNDYLQLGAEGGLLMCAPIVVTAVLFLVAIRRRLRQDIGSVWWIRLGAVTGIAAIALQSLVEFSLQMPGNAALFVVLCGIALHDSEHRDARANVTMPRYGD